ncbi:BlaI/MecI/CopY family transcriptional regulator [Intestinimonas massiliensis (ex Afouda et al. 2020)]|uniref:BlaI/MecI/CopY family transcriptional regulator n=1 Tax=Intestinimonas massiliensis (ex Afouda et al. 2020) TaxID=1673721 RepID=UPI0010308246|nr:BlaI/MecI/CopY family transcriptional regulator [Intestinimonas massiliensis (ex Afouda et al. 2020)]
MKAIRRLPDAELEVMQALWRCEPPASRTDVAAALPPEHPMAVTTLLTVLTRLGEKGFLRADRDGRRSLYTPLISQADYLAAQSRTFVQKVCGGSLPAFAAALCDSGLTKEELEQLRDLLERDAL